MAYFVIFVAHILSFSTYIYVYLITYSRITRFRAYGGGCKSELWVDENASRQSVHKKKKKFLLVLYTPYLPGPFSRGLDARGTDHLQLGL